MNLMAPKQSSLHQQKIIRAFAEHGVVLKPASGLQLTAVSPWSESGTAPMYVNRFEGVWDCKTSGRSGDLLGFLKAKGELNQLGLEGKIAQRLALNRHLSVSTLVAWGVGWDGYQYTIPVCAIGKTTDLRRYQIGQKAMSTSGGKPSLIGPVDSWGKQPSKTVWLCEGEWDGMALWEVLREQGVHDTVLAVPGASIFPDDAAQFLSGPGRCIHVMYDNDRAGRVGAIKVASSLSGTIKEIKFLKWPEVFEDGFDVRDLCKQQRDPEKTLTTLTGWLVPTPPDPDGYTGSGRPGFPGHLSVGEDGITRDNTAVLELDALTGKGVRPEKVLAAYRKHLYLHDPTILEILFGTMFANRLDGDPVWLFLVAPPGGTKTELLLSLAEAPVVQFLSSLTPKTLVSGAPNYKGGDPSLFPKLHMKVLILKDFTTILSMNSVNRDEIFGTLRETYDGRFEKGWGTGLFRTYFSKFGIIAGVTPMIEKFSASSSVLGERFLKYRSERPQRIAGDDLLIDAALQNLNKETRIRKDLQAVAKEVLSRKVTDIPAVPERLHQRIRKLAQWVARLRSTVHRESYTRTIEFNPASEVGTRLVKQFAKLAQGISIYNFEREVSLKTYSKILTVARGTVPDRVESVVRCLFTHDEKSLTIDDLGTALRTEKATIRLILQDLELLRIVMKHQRGKFVTYELSSAMRSITRDTQIYEGKRWKLQRAAKEEVKE